MPILNPYPSGFISRFAFAAIGAAMLAAWAGTVLADEASGNPADGLAFAKGHCAECHLVEGDWQDIAKPYPPAFAQIAADPKYTDLSLRVFLRTPHLNMPDFILTERETADVVAYIISLKSN